MNERITAQDISLALQTADLHPYIKGINRFGIHRDWDDYEVLTELLPEIYIRKTVSSDLFDWREDKRILACVVNVFNAKPFPVRAVIGYDKIAFALNTEVVSADYFSARIMSWLDQIEEARDLFGQCCAMVVRDWEKDDLNELTKQLSDPNSDNSWLNGQKES